MMRRGILSLDNTHDCARHFYANAYINSGTIVAVIIEATTTADRKSRARRLDVSKMVSVRDLYESEERHALTYCTLVLVTSVCCCCCWYSWGEPPSRHIRGKVARSCGTGPHNGHRVFSRRHRVEKNPENIRRSFLRVFWYLTYLIILNKGSRKICEVTGNWNKQQHNRWFFFC